MKFLISFSIAFLTSASKHKPPNVLFIVADDLGWNDVSWHNPNIHSPALEQLASEGVVLDQYYVQPTCSPSRVSFMTGQYPHRLGRQHMYIKPRMPTGLPANVKIMPEYFKHAGYTTHAIGKWHLGYCHQNYTPTFRGFDSFYGFYLGSEDYYTHSNINDGGYDFRFNENILRGREVDGKYSADLFVNRAKSIFEEQRRLEKTGDGKPWFVYLSFQSVHSPLQVPNIYKSNVCQYKDSSRYFYSAMVSSLDHSVERGGTRGIAFLHSPLLKHSGLTSTNLMHGVDWLPTFMAAIGSSTSTKTAKDGVSQWEAMQDPALPQPRDEVVYNIKEKPFMAALRLGDYKIIWGSRTPKDTWFPALEEPRNKLECEKLLRSRSSFNRSRNILVPRDTTTMDNWTFEDSGDMDYEADYDELEKLQAIDLESSEIDEMTEIEEYEPEVTFSILGIRIGREASGGKKKKGNGKHKNNKNKFKKKKKKFLSIANKNNVKIRSWGNVMLFNLKEDPEEKFDLSSEQTEVVESLKARAVQHFYNLYPREVPEEREAGNPKHWGGYYAPGWCQVYNINE